jgi:hypothetical protein
MEAVAEGSGDTPLLDELVAKGHADDREDAAHVLDLVRRGILRLGKAGPLPISEPGPRIPGAHLAIAQDRRGR